MFVIKLCLAVYCGFFLPSNISADIDMDYFYGPSPLRTASSCDNANIGHICHVKCGGGRYGCIAGQCFCLNESFQKGLLNTEEPSDNDVTMTNQNLKEMIQTLRENSYEEEEGVEIEEEEHPALRHHIAHFCSNLQVARECIRTCQKVGKPAFCGKDHVCYCGHRYTSHDLEKPIDVEDVNSQFQDLYTKYFGANV